MSVNNRFLGEYALTGAFFWTAQFIVLYAVDPPNGAVHSSGESTSVLVYQITNAINRVASALLPDVINNSVVAILFIALIVMIFTGLVLDLLKIAFRPLEMNKFVGHIDKAESSKLPNTEESWLETKVKKHSPYVQDYRKLYTLHEQRKRHWPIIIIPVSALLDGVIGPFKRWRKSSQEDSTVKVLTDRYVKLFPFLISFVLVHSNQTNLEPLTQGTRLWRSSREMSVAAFFLVVEGIFILSLHSLGSLNPFAYLSLLDPVYLRTAPILITIAVLVIVLFISMNILNSVFSRLCYTLFSLFYITAEKVEYANMAQELKVDLTHYSQLSTENKDK